MKRLILIAVLPLFFTNCGKQSKTETSTAVLPDSTVIKIAAEAYQFGVPLVLMDITRRKMTDGNNKEASAQNAFAHKSSFPDANFRDVVRPNADTYYSTASLDLTKEPIILSVPNTHGRYYMMPMLDAYTNVFASPGTRTTGNGAHDFLITGPGWNGDVPANLEQIKAPTNMVWIIGRTQVNNKADGDKVVVPLQKQYKLTSLSAWGKPYAPPAPTPDATLSKEGPNEILAAMPVEDFFNYVNKLMVDNPPADADKPVLEKFTTIGVSPGGSFDIHKFDSATREALRKIPAELFSQAKQFSNVGQLVNGWNPMRATQGTYGTDYQTRAMIAIAGLGANLREDAVYPNTSQDDVGNKLTGDNKYMIHFEKGNTPPANAFWSITLYDNSGYMVANALNRNAIGDRSGLKKNADGSTDIYIQKDSPGKEKESNWLPAPEGEFNLLLRVYWPKEEMLNGNWTVPGVKKIK